MKEIEMDNKNYTVELSEKPLLDFVDHAKMWMLPLFYN